MTDHRLLKIPAVILPIDEGVAVRRQDKLQELHRGDFILVDLIGIEIDLPLRKFGQVRILVDFSIAPHEELARRDTDHLVMRRQLGALHRQLLAFRRPFTNDIGNIQRIKGTSHS